VSFAYAGQGPFEIWIKGCNDEHASLADKSQGRMTQGNGFILTCLTSCTATAMLDEEAASCLGCVGPSALDDISLYTFCSFRKTDPGWMPISTAGNLIVQDGFSCCTAANLSA
jgi:hypothetical protein